MKQLSIYLVLSFFALISCKEEKHGSKFQESNIQTKKYILPNDEFREKILPKLKHENDRKKLGLLLNTLDQKEISFCNFVKREFEIDDSCYSIALKEFPAPEMQNEFIKLHDKVYEKAQTRYLKQIELNNKDADFLTIVYSFDENVKSFCGRY